MKTAPSSPRPFRHLCPEAEARDLMTDEEFWAHVFRQDEDWGPDDWEPDEQFFDWLDHIICPECGGYGACAYDQEGRPLIHADFREDDDD